MAEGLAAQLRLRLLGPLEISDVASGESFYLYSSKAKELLALLASTRGRSFSRDELIEHLWAEDLESRRTTLERAQANLRRRIAELRQLHPVLAQCIRTEAHGYCFIQDPAAWIDIEEFAKQCERGRALAQQGRCAEARAVLERAVQLYRGDFLAEEPYAEWAIAPRERWRERYRQACALLTECDKRLLKIPKRRRHKPQLLGPLPWVGRERELAILHSHFVRACAGYSTGVLIAGESGVGKTRLVQEFLASVRDFSRLTVLLGRADETARTVAYSPVRRALELKLPELSRTRLRTLSSTALVSVAEIVPELRALRPELPHLPELPPQQVRLRLWEGLAQLFGALASSKPLVLFLDDLHWADPSTLEFLGYLLTRRAHAKMLFVGCYRAEEISPELAALHERARSVGAILPLERLSLSEVERLLHQARITASHLAHRLYRETQGNPFFIATVLTNLIHSGVLQYHHDRWVLTVRELSADYSKLFIPSDVHQAIRHRLATLDGQERRCLELAAVLGQEFDYALLERAWSGDGSLSEVVAHLLH
ncbi:MAG: AAA family ATPase, partial [Candidatus Bipolaricaulia bacterium]